MLVEDEVSASRTSVDPEIEGSWAALARPRYLASIVMLSLGVALFAFNEFFVSTAMPSAIQELGKPWMLAWAFTIYLVFAIVGGALAAYLKGRLGSRVTLVAATLVFLLGTLLACLAPHWSYLLGGRLLQGLGEGITIALCYALIPELFPKPLIAKVFGVEAIAWAAAAFGGPLLAGLLTEYVSWRAAFACSLPAALAFVLLVLAIAPGASSAGQPASPVPLLRLMLVGVAILMVSMSGSMESELVILSLLIASAWLLLLFVWIDRKDAHSILPRNAFSATRLPGAGIWVVLLMPVAGSAAAVFLVYGLQVVWGLGPAEAGVSGAVMALSWSFTAILVASIRSDDARRRLIGLGPTLLAAGIGVIIAALVTDLYWIVYPGQSIVGIGFGVSWGTLSQLLIDRAPDVERDKTSTILPTLQSAGYAIGGAVFGLVASIAGLKEGLSAEATREVLLPVFAGGFVVALAAAGFGYRTVRFSERRGS